MVAALVMKNIAKKIIISHSFSNKYSSKYILYYCTLLIDKVGYFGDVVGVSYG